MTPRSTSLQRLRHALLMALLPWAAAAQDRPLFKADARTGGAPFDMTVTELRREADRSLLDVPGFHERSAAASRWLMCAYTELAAQRGFTRWVAVTPPAGRTQVMLWLTNDERTAGGEIAGPDIDRERLLDAKVSTLAPLCLGMPATARAPEAARSKGPFVEGEFAPDPTVPPREGADRFVGRWVHENGHVQIEVARDESSGRLWIRHDASDNWSYLYNGVHWVGDDLHYSAFSYSTRPTLFAHPYHKHVGTASLAALPEPGRLRWTFGAERRRQTAILTRQDPPGPSAAQPSAASQPASR